MKESCFNNVARKLWEVFVCEFRFAYSDIKTKGKNNILKYSNSFLRRWMFSSVISNLELSPADIIYETNDHKFALPLIYNVSIQKIGHMAVKMVEYSCDNPPIIEDIKLLYELAESGIRYDEGINLYDDELYKNIYKKLNIEDPEYLNYIIYLSVRLGILNIMPSIGINMICKGSNSLFNLKNREIFSIIVKEAINIAAEKFEEYSLDENFITSQDIVDWLKYETSVDCLFDKYFSCMDWDMNIIEYKDGFESFLEELTYERGIAFDKWFLTPFGFYLGLIIPSYTTQYDMNYDMKLFFDVLKTNIEFDSDYDCSLILYSPCSYYRLSDVGRDFFGINENIKSKHIFNNYSPEHITDLIYNDELELARKDIIFNYYPPYNVYKFRLTWDIDHAVWFDIAMSEYINLDEFAKMILFFLLGRKSIIRNYKFYTIPESPFTQYIYPKCKKGGSVFTTRLNNIFEGRNTLMFNANIVSEGMDFEFDFKIEVIDVCLNTAETIVPHFSKSSKKFKTIFFQ